MSASPKWLTALQKEIVDALTNDYEDLKQIQEILDQSMPIEQLAPALWSLIEEGYVACYRPTKTEMKPVVHPDRQELNHYWFALTERGQQLPHALEHVQ